MRLRLPRVEVCRWLVAYDIADDPRRVKVAKVLLRHGWRIQQSVYELELTRAALRRLVGTLGDMIHRWEDRLDLVPMCAACERRRRGLGRAPDVPGDFEAF